MALIPKTYETLLINTSGFTGSDFQKFARGVSIGVTTHLVSNPLSVIQSIGDIGAPGTGSGFGSIVPGTMSISVLKQLLDASLIGGGMSGVFMPSLITSIAISTCSYIQSASSISTHAGVGVGTGVGTIINLSPAQMSTLIQQNTGYTDANLWPRMASAISVAICSFLMSSVKFGIVITGPAGSGVTTGSGSGKII